MSDLIPGLLVGLALACVVGVPLAIIGALVAELAEHGRRRKPAPVWRRWARPLADRARRLRMPPASAPATWATIRAGMRPAPRYVDTSRTLEEMVGPDDWEPNPWDDGPDPEPYEPDDDRPAVVPMSPDPEVKPFTGWQVPDDWRLPGVRGLMFARPGKQPWLTGTMPAIPAPPVPAAYDPGDGLTPIPFLPGYAPEPAYGVASCQLDVAEAERLAAAMLP